jgi:hypothetical protein
MGRSIGTPTLWTVLSYGHTSTPPVQWVGKHAEALGRSRGGFSTKIHTKIHIRAEGGGKPMALVIAGGERHESQYLNALLDATQVRRRDRERPRSRPRRLVGKKGYSYPTVRRALARRHIHAVIPRRSRPVSAVRAHPLHLTSMGIPCRRSAVSKPSCSSAPSTTIARGLTIAASTTSSSWLRGSRTRRRT